MSKEVKAALISGIFIIIAAIIGMFSFNINIENNKLNEDNKSLILENDKLKITIANLKDGLSQYDNLKGENNELKNELESLNNEINQYSTLLEENESLENEIIQLQNEIQSLKNNNSEDESDLLTLDILATKKVSIFDLDTFRGAGNWEIPTSKGDYTDTYGNEYTQAHVTFHYPTSKDDLSLVPTYLLNYKYSICEGQIAWAKSEKNASGSVWIEFYSDNNLIYSTDHITATDKIITFSFSVENLETLTIVKNTNRGSYLSSVTIIYPYLNLIE